MDGKGVRVQGRKGVQRATLSEAAELLGISKGAVRQRVRRGTLRSDKGEDGRVYVYVDPTADAVSGPSVGDPRDALIAELQDRVRSLEDANRENRRIIAGLVQRVPAIEAPQEPRESPESPGPSDTPTPAPEEAQEAAEPPRDRTNRLQQELLETRQLLEDERSRPWWRRMFGG